MLRCMIALTCVAEEAPEEHTEAEPDRAAAPVWKVAHPCAGRLAEVVQALVGLQRQVPVPRQQGVGTGALSKL